MSVDDNSVRNIVVANLRVDPLVERCTLCMKPLFSTGGRVVKIRRCGHYLHQTCLERGLRVGRLSAEGEVLRERCPTCPNRNVVIGITDPANYPEVANFFDTLPCPGHKLTIVVAKKVVQYLLWSSVATISGNVKYLLSKLRENHLPAVAFASRFRIVQESGMVQACMTIIKENANDSDVIKEVLQFLGYCLELGYNEEVIGMAIEHLDGFYESVLTSSALLELDVKRLVMPLIRKFSEHTGNDGRLSVDSIPRLTRIIPGVVRTMRAHPDSIRVQEGGCDFLRYISVEDGCAQALVASGALLVLHEAHRKYRLQSANLALQHLLSLNLRLVP